MHTVNTIELKLIQEASDSKESLCEVQLNQKNTEIFIRGESARTSHMGEGKSLSDLYYR